MKILELKNTISKVKNSLDGFNNRIELTKERVNLKINQQKVSNLKRDKKKDWEKRIESLTDLQDDIKRSTCM